MHSRACARGVLPQVVRYAVGNPALGRGAAFARMSRGFSSQAGPLGFGNDFKEPTGPVDKSKILVTVKNPGTTQLSLDEPIPGLPEPKLTSSLERPGIKISTLSNGLRVISHESYGQVSNVGLSIAVGSRFETEEERGLNHLMEFMMMKGTRRRSHQKIVEEMEQMGAHVSIKTGREQMMMHIDVLRDHAEQAIEILCESITNPVFSEEEIEYQKMSMALDYEHLHLSSNEMINELILEAAYGPDSELGPYILFIPHFLPSRLLSRLFLDVTAEILLPPLLPSPGKPHYYDPSNTSDLSAEKL